MLNKIKDYILKNAIAQKMIAFVKEGDSSENPYKRLLQTPLARKRMQLKPIIDLKGNKKRGILRHFSLKMMKYIQRRNIGKKIILLKKHEKIALGVVPESEVRANKIRLNTSWRKDTETVREESRKFLDKVGQITLSSIDEKNALERLKKYRAGKSDKPLNSLLEGIRETKLTEEEIQKKKDRQALKNSFMALLCLAVSLSVHYEIAQTPAYQEKADEVFTALKPVVKTVAKETVRLVKEEMKNEEIQRKKAIEKLKKLKRKYDAKQRAKAVLQNQEIRS